MVQPVAAQVVFVPVLQQVGIHLRDARGFVVIGAEVHHLHAQPLVDGQQLRGGAVQILLSGRGLHGPVEVHPRDEIRQADHGDPAERGLVRAAAQPEALQRRDNVLEEALDLMVGFIAHFQCVRHGVQDADGLLIRAVRLVRVALSAHGDVMHLRNLHDLGAGFGQIERFVFLFEVKSHGGTS